MRVITVFIVSFLIALGILVAALLPTGAAFALVAPTSPARVVPAALPQRATGCAYRIRQGDNLFRIGLRYGVSYTYLAQLNGIPNPNLIYAGATLAVPCRGSAVVSRPANCAASQSYTVQRGDNLWRIGYNFKTDLALLIATNNMYGRVLRPGMVLTIPCPGSVPYKEVPVPEGQPANPPPAPPPSETPPPGPQVLIQNGQLSLPNIVVVPGTTITWINQDATPETLVSTAGAPFTSPAIQPGGSWSMRFDNVGKYDYQLQSNPNVKGTVQVQLPGAQ